MEIRLVHKDTSIKAPRTQEGDIQNIRTVGGRHHDDVGSSLEPIHLREDLIEGLLALVVPTAESGSAALTADGIDLIDEDDGRSIALGLGKEIANAGGAHAHEHLNEFRTGDAEERDARLPCNRARKERLARSGSADEEHTLGNLCANARVLAGIAEKIDDLDQIFLCLIRARDVDESRLHLLGVGNTSFGFSKRHGVALAPRDAPEHPVDTPEDEEEEDDVGQYGKQHVARLLIFYGHDGGVLGIVPTEIADRIRVLLVRAQHNTVFLEGRVDHVVTHQNIAEFQGSVPLRDTTHRYLLSVRVLALLAQLRIDQEGER